ncbi:hypothetical protein HOY82DRAFT_60683 [Tuber indicum]|nr:hypothetical protein HOY82DRAFT_60683 [Tuber indicum]
MAQTPFTLFNIPFGVFSTEEDPRPRCATRVGEKVLDLKKYAADGGAKDIEGFIPGTFAQPSLNAFAQLSSATRSAVRQRIREDVQGNHVKESCFVEASRTKMHLPMHIGDYSDFYCSLEHCQNCSAHLSMPQIPKNWFYAPSVYNSRVSSILPSPSTFKRPSGVYYKTGTEEAVYGPSQMVDFELEMGYFVSKPVPHGETMNVGDAKQHIFGFVLLNDWSSRDLQMFEMKPLGPFHGKGSATTISPWIVTMDALEEFSVPVKTIQNPPCFPHLAYGDKAKAALNIKLFAYLERAGKRFKISQSNLRYLYWTPYQQLAHHASAGCGLNAGDLMGTGTISGDAVDADGKKLELGCLYEATEGGTKSVRLQAEDGSGQAELRYLLDGDEVVFEAWCGDMKLGFGECRGMLVG